MNTLNALKMICRRQFSLSTMSRTSMLMQKNLLYPCQNSITTILPMTSLFQNHMRTFQRRIHSKDSSQPPRMFMEVSSKNKSVRLLNKLKTERQRRKAEVIRIEGLQMISAAMENKWLPDFILTTNSNKDAVLQLVERFDPKQKIRLLSSTEDVVAMSMKNSRLQSMVAFGPQPNTSSPGSFLRKGADSTPPIHIVLACQDPTNMGSIVRTAVAHGMRKFIVWRDACSPYNDTTIRTSAGAVLSANFVAHDRVPDDVFHCATLLGACSHEGESLTDAFIAAEELWDSGKHLRTEEEERQHCILLVFGHETKGLPRDINGLMRKVHIPIDSAVESLGVAAAAAILINHLFTTTTSSTSSTSKQLQ
eukprot:m.241184 g.241184  ORF g.241184 m.241184 type:complete len:364 (+) comp18560_c0_seq1:294-1385(+)